LTEAGTSSVEVCLSTGERILVSGTLEEVEKQLSDAARSGATRLAWFSQSSDGEPVALNPTHVASLRAG
jgi:hypothetical protein